MIESEPRLGWRAWFLDRLDGQVVLRSMNAGTGSGNRHDLDYRRMATWPQRERMAARCRHGNRHAAPADDCSCGIYAANSNERLRAEFSYGRDDSQVVGTVMLWGDVVVADWGFRAQFAYPKRLYVPATRWRDALELREVYGVTTRLWNPYEWEVI